MEEEKVNNSNEEHEMLTEQHEQNTEIVKVEAVEQPQEQMDTTEEPSVTSNEQTAVQASSELDAIAQLQQLSAANSQLVQAAAAALSGNGNFPFLTNFENLAAMAVAAASSDNANTTTTTPSTTSNTTATTSTAVSTTPKPNSKFKPPVDLSQLPADLLKRELMNQKVHLKNYTPLILKDNFR